MTNATTNDRSNATGVGNMTSPGAGASTGTTNPGNTATGNSVTGTSNTVPAMGTPIGSTAAGGLDLGGAGASSAGGGDATESADAGVADAGDAGGDTGDVDGVDGADAGAPDAAPDAGDEVDDGLDDGQVVAVVEALNASEIEQAQAVLPRLQSDAVRSFAQLMLEEHQRARDALAALAAAQQLVPAGSDLAEQVRAQGQQVTTELDAVDASELDAAYLGAQVTAHSEATTLLETLIADTDSEALAAELTELRLNLQGHLQAAAALQESVQNGTAL